MTYFENNFPEYRITPDGKVYKGNKALKQFKSNKYLQVVLWRKDKKRRSYGVHSLIAMQYIPECYEGCIVHHIDGDCHNNIVDNLEVMSQSKHASKHREKINPLVEHIKNNPNYAPYNKGKKMSTEFCKKCSDSAKKRGFVGNQFIDKFGNRK